MKAIKTLLIFTVIAAVSASCTKTETHQGGEQDDRVAVRFATEVATRAIGDTWTAGDVIGVRMINAADATVDGVSNKPYETKHGGTSVTFAPLDNNDIYYPMDDSAVGFAAYYPSTAIGENGNYRIDLSEQRYPEEIDLMWAKTSVIYKKTNPDATLRFEHMLSRLVIEAKADASVGQPLTGMTVVAKGLNTAASFNILTGLIEDREKIVNLSLQPVTDGVTYAAIVLPGTITAGTVEVDFTISSGETFTWEVPATEFETGKDHPWEITLTRTGVGAVQGTITDWGTGQGGNGNAE